MSRRLIPASLGCAALVWIALTGAAPQDPPPVSRIDPILQVEIERLEAELASRGTIGEIGQLSRTAGVVPTPLTPDDPLFRVIVRGGGAEGAILEVGGRVGTRLGPVVTAWVPMSGLRTLAGKTGVEYVEASTLLYPELDTSVPATRADLVHGGNYNLRGQGVLVCIFDTGLDYTHDDFQNADGTTRVLYMWDQTVSGTPPSGFGYGVEWTKSDIDAELGASPPGVVSEQDLNGHGTHVAGIAAGNGLATGNSQPSEKYVGMAPEADLLIIKGGNDSFPTSNVIDGIAWAMAKANQLGQPIVINLSIGGHSGAHDGTRTHEQAIAAAVGQGKVVVASAGNSADDQIHDRVTLTGSGVLDSMKVNISEYTPASGTSNDYVLFNIWYDGSASVTVSVTGPDLTSTYGPWISGSSTAGETQASGYVYANNASSGTDPRNGDKQMVLQFFDDVEGIEPSAGEWTIYYELASGDSTHVDLWIDGDTIDATVVGGGSGYTVSEPGTGTGEICVGSYITKKSWLAIDGGTWGWWSLTEGDISPFSSWGPTRDGRQKPDISAPGQGIMAALSTQMSSQPAENVTDPDGVHRLTQGTSMAAPHVTGAVALLLQAQPYLTASQVRDHLTNTAVRDGFTGGSANNTWGHGKMDVKAAVDVVLASSDTTAPDFTVGILRNSVLTDFLDLYFVPSEILSEAPTAMIDTTSLELSLVTSTEATLYVSDYTIPSSGTFTISVTGSDLAGNDTTVTREFVAQLISSSEGGLLIAAGGALQATFTPQALERDEYIIARKLKDGMRYELQPHGMILSRKIRLVISYNPAQLEEIDPSSLGMYRWEEGEWRYVESWVDVSRRQVEATVSKLGIYRLLSSDDNPAAPSFSYGLEQNYPNPFNGTTRIRYTLARQTDMELLILNTRGQRVRTLVDRVEAAGSHVVSWDGDNDSGQPVASGIYLVMLRADGRIFTRKALLLR
jgi:subtilisin family serine protease